MMRFVKPAMLASLAIGCLALGSGAQQPSPPAPPPAPTRGLAVTPDGHLQEQLFTYGPKWYMERHDAADALTVQLAKQLVDAKTDGDKEKLKEKLKETLGKQFDDRQKRHEKEIEALEAQIKKLKDMVAKRQENKKDIIDDRTKQLEREAKGLGW